MFVAYILPAIPQVALHTHPLLVSFVMLPRRGSTNITSDPTLPRPISGSFSGRQPLSVATNQQSFRADTAGILETESPQSETSPQAIPPLPPPRPISFPHLPPGVSGLRRQSTRQNTYGTYTSVSEEYASTSSQPPSIGHMPSPKFPQVPGRPPPAPIRHPQPAPGGVGGFALPNRDVGRDNSYRNTADYAYRFDTIPSLRSDSDPPHYESKDVTGGIHARVWPTYNKISKEYDDKMLEKWNSDLDVLLIFVSVVLGLGHRVRSN